MLSIKSFAVAGISYLILWVDLTLIAYKLYLTLAFSDCLVGLGQVRGDAESGRCLKLLIETIFNIFKQHLQMTFCM